MTICNGIRGSDNIGHLFYQPIIFLLYICMLMLFIVVMKHEVLHSKSTDRLRRFGSVPVKADSKERWGLISGDSIIFPYALNREVFFYNKGHSIFNLDCAMRFNLFTLTQEAGRIGIPPDEILNQIRVRRAFTPYQILDSTYELLTEKNPDPAGLSFFLAPLKQFYDGDVAEDEADYLIQILIDMLSGLKRRGISFLLIEKENYAHRLHEKAMKAFIQLTGSLRVIHKSEMEQSNRLETYAIPEAIPHGSYSDTILKTDRNDRSTPERISQRAV